ncbi:MAG: heme-binding protein, partial [Xanthomonadales bacterium]|nr:heme-binding protein [Xanthomonadales bacterium]
PAFAAIDGIAGDLLAVTAYTDGSVLTGTAFGEPESGIRPDQGDYPGLDAFVLVDANQQERFPPIAGTDGPDALTPNEVRTLMREALNIANRARAQIRRPLGDRARVTVSIVDSNGVILAIARSRDAPVFGIDVSLQKARTAAFFSAASAAIDLESAPNAIYRNPDGSPSGIEIVIGDYVQAARVFLGSATALEDGAIAFSDRAGGNLSRPFYPDGIPDRPPGPFSKPIDQWSPFTVGLQLDLNLNRVVQHVVHVLTGGAQPDSPQNCTAIDRLRNGIQIFPGSVPIYRGSVLVGGIGVSGDGIDQDDMIAFLGLHQAGLQLGTINNAPPAMRADQLTPFGARLRYVQCPYAPFNNSSETNVCTGK